ncbi:hypothetical protein [Geotalea sp. SG265]|uniref:hypothetical protein n=1 Tax=Geotalea sp. SG265 TaxID=2922867 RepID=UPI001FAEE53B|nr:hypothetical protein [Geotalea sp. SG265]
MKLQYLGDSKDSFKWDYHDFLADTLKVPSLDVLFMMTPDDGGDDGKTHPSLFPARRAIIDFCHEVRSSRSVEKVKLLPQFTKAKYRVRIHRKEEHFTHQNRREYFGAVPCNAGKLFFLDPDNGFEPEKSCGEKHVSYKDIHNLLCQLPNEAVISVFHHFRRIRFTTDFERIKERLGDCHATAIYWHSLMFVAVSKSKETIASVTEANRSYSENYPVKVIL